MAAKIRTNDLVKVIAGKNKGLQGKVLKIFREKNSIIVEGVNIVTKHKKANQSNAGEILKVEHPIHISNVALIDPSSKKPTKVGFRLEKDKKDKTVRIRVAKISGKDIL